MKLDLSDVTICAADCANAALAARALHQSMAHCNFGDAILFTDVPGGGSFRTVQISRLSSRMDYSHFIVKRLPSLIKTPFALIVQWDGYVLEPSAWRSEFRDYDFIGARWHWFNDGMTVGNGGFSLRSRKLLNALMDQSFSLIPNITEDGLICRVYRPALISEYDIRFAPENIADLFSYERTLPDARTFGFHGLFNMWRHVEDGEMIRLVEQFSPHLFRTREFVELLGQYFVLRKFGPLRALYAKLRANQQPDEIHRMMMHVFNNEQIVQSCIRTCESVV